MLRAVVEQHAEEAAFLFTMRGALVRAPHARVADLVRADERIAANLEGMKIARAGVVEARARGALARGDAGEVFAAAVLALESPSAERVAHVIDASPPRRARAQARRGAPRGCRSRGWRRRSPNLRASPSSSLASGRARRPIRHPPGATRAGRSTWPSSIDDADLQRDHALRAIGELPPPGPPRRALRRRAARRNERDSRFWAAWSAILLGDASAVPVLSPAMATRGGPYARKRRPRSRRSRGPTHEAVAWIADLSPRPELRRIAARAAAALGDPGSIPMLLDWMTVPRSRASPVTR